MIEIAGGVILAYCLAPVVFMVALLLMWVVAIVLEKLQK